MESLPWSTSTPQGSKQPQCDYRDPITGKICGKQYSKGSNLRRHIKEKHSGGVQDADYTDFDDSQSMTSHDSSDDLPVAESSFELRRTHGAAPLAPMTPPLPTSGPAQTASTVDTTLAPRNGLNAADGWLINGSLAPRSVPAGWSPHSPRSFITSAPRMASPFLSPSEHTGQSMYQLTGDLTSENFANSVPQTIGQTTDQLPYDFDQDLSAYDLTSEEVAQMMDSVPQTMSRTPDQRASDLGPTSNPIPQGINPDHEWMTEDFRQSLSVISQGFGQFMNHLASMSRSSSPVPQDFSGQIMNTVPQDVGHVMNNSPMASPTPQNFSQTMSPYPYDVSRQTTRRLPAVVSATHSPSTAGRGTPQSPVPGANQKATRMTPDSPTIVQDPGVLSDSDVPPASVTVAATGRKRKLSYSNASRPLQALTSEILPSYAVKRSKKIPEQQRGIDWLKKEAKLKFEDFYRELLARWGVAVGHTGTCVLVPEAYKALEPLEVMETITQDKEKYAAPGTPRAFFSMYDHATTVVRARAWFSEWPRSGVQLDNFIGSGKFAPMDASHTCHHDHCIVHITYEAADKNTKREECRREARALRQQNAADVPEHCSRHQPPCLMQVGNSTDPERTQLTAIAYCAVDFRSILYPICGPPTSQTNGRRPAGTSAETLPVCYVRDPTSLYLSVCPCPTGITGCGSFIGSKGREAGDYM